MQIRIEVGIVATVIGVSLAPSPLRGQAADEGVMPVPASVQASREYSHLPGAVWWGAERRMTLTQFAQYAAPISWLSSDETRFGPLVGAVREYCDRSGRFRWQELTPRAIGAVLKLGTPILAGTNGTYHYQAMRETSDRTDDVLGDPFGHFVVICGSRSLDMTACIADPLQDNSMTGSKYYRASVYRLIEAIDLGASSDDANLLVIRPKARPAARGQRS